MKNIINKRYNELTVLKEIPRPNTDKYRSWNTNKWLQCECSCGKIIEVPKYGVEKGLIKSCGHYRSIKAFETLRENKKDNPTPTAINITYNGETKNINQWAEATGIPRTTIDYRLKKGLPLEKVFEVKT